MPSTKFRDRNSLSQWTIKADDADERVARAIRICVGRELQGMYRDLLNEPLPPKITDLLHRLDKM